MNIRVGGLEPSSEKIVADNSIVLIGNWVLF